MYFWLKRVQVRIELLCVVVVWCSRFKVDPPKRAKLVNHGRLEMVNLAKTKGSEQKRTEQMQELQEQDMYERESVCVREKLRKRLQSLGASLNVYKGF